MTDIRTRSIAEKRVVIRGNGAWLSREGNTVTIRHDYAGRFTDKDIRLSVSDIRELAKFVEETDASHDR